MLQLPLNRHVCVCNETLCTNEIFPFFCTVWFNRQEPPDSNCLQEEDAVKFKKKKFITFSVKDKKENHSYNEENCEDT